MSERWQIRRGTTQENDDFTGAQGELTMDTQKKGLRVHDGTTQGGIEVPTAGTADYVVEWQAPNPNDGYKWYRKYKSGWVEQGGLAAQTTSSATVGSTVVLPVEMSDGNYFITFCNYNTNTGNGSTAYVQDTAVINVTTTGFTFCRNYNGPKRWEVKGMAA